MAGQRQLSTVGQLHRKFLETASRTMATPKKNASSMVVDYYYSLQHPENDEDTSLQQRGRTFSFGLANKEGSGANRKCFVISPIGSEESEIRQHANDVFNFIILPALHSHGIDCIRSDMISDLGQISDQMYEAIFQWDLCVAVLTFGNPNVFYELALRHCVGLPVICLILKEQSLPFNVADMRVIEYTLKPKPLFDGIYAEDVANAVDSLSRQHWKCAYPFTKFNPSICSAPTFFSSFHDMESQWTEDRFSEFLKQGRNNINIMGTLLPFTRKFEDDLREAAARHCHVRILVLGKDNPALRNVIHFRGKQFEALRLNMDHWFFSLSVLAKSSSYITLRNVAKGMVLFGCLQTEKEVIFQPGFYSSTSVDDLPLFYSDDPKSSLFQSTKTDFELLWKLNEESDSSRLEEIVEDI